MRLAPGDHELRLVAETYAEWTVRVKLLGGETITLPTVELAPLRFIASSTETGLKPAIRSRLDKPTVGVIATRLAADCFEK